MKLATFKKRDIKTLHGRRALCMLVPFPAYTGCLKVRPVLLPQVEGRVRTAQGPLGPRKDTFDSRASTTPCPAVVGTKDTCDLIARGLVYIRGIDPCTLGAVNWLRIFEKAREREGHIMHNLRNML